MQAVLPSEKSEGGVGSLSESIMSLFEDLLLQSLIAHDRNCIMFVPCLNEEQWRITFGRKLQPLNFPAIIFRKASGCCDLHKYNGKAKQEQTIRRFA